jgi:hypothetical protein
MEGPMKRIAVGLLFALLALGTANAQAQPPEPAKTQTVSPGGDAADAFKALTAMGAGQGSFWEKVIIAAVGPLVGAVVGSLLVGGLVSLIADRIQQRRLDAQLREQLIVEMTQAAGALYFQTQRYWRATNANSPVKLVSTPEQATASRLNLDECYQASRVAGEAIEARLHILFEAEKVAGAEAQEAAKDATKWPTNEPWRLWHATMDLLTVRYFQVIGGATPKLLEINAGPEHSFLSAKELENPKMLLKAYRERLLQATKAVLNSPRTSHLA